MVTVIRRHKDEVGLLCEQLTVVREDRDEVVRLAQIAPAALLDVLIVVWRDVRSADQRDFIFQRCKSVVKAACMRMRES